MRTAQNIEANLSDKTPKLSGRGKHPKSRANLAAPWKPGQSGNPGGKPKRDMAQEIAEAVLTHNAEKIYQAYTKALLSGNAYAFQVIADRGFGKLKETREVTHRYEEVPDIDLQKRVDDLMRDLGLAKAVDEVVTVQNTETAKTPAI